MRRSLFSSLRSNRNGLARWAAAVLCAGAVCVLPLGASAQNGPVSAQECCLSVLLPFVRTGMTSEYVENPKVYGRWQPRMLEPHEAARALLELLVTDPATTDEGMFELLVEGTADQVAVRWARVRLDPRTEPLDRRDDPT